MAKPVLGYWFPRGVAEPIRYLLHFKGVSFEDKRYHALDEWLNDKFQLNLDFPNLPYYIDGKTRLTQSLAILRRLARKHGLAGETEEERIRVELVEQQLIDFRGGLLRLVRNPEFEKVKAEFIKGVPAQLKLLSAFLGDRSFLAGDRITYVDFVAYDTFDFYRMFIPGVLKNFPNLLEYQERFENLPELQKYLKSSTYKRWPVFGPDAFFGGKGDEPERV